MTKTKHIMAGIVVIVAILCVTTLELYALSRGINGVLLTGSIATISAAAAGYAGYKVSHKE